MKTNFFIATFVLIMLMLQAIIITIPHIKATEETFSITLQPEYDCWIDSGTTWYNETDELTCDDTGDAVAERPSKVIVIQWDTSAIPDNAVVTEASLHFYVSEKVDDASDTWTRILRMEYSTLDDGSNVSDVFTDARSGRYYHDSSKPFEATGWWTMNTSDGYLDGTDGPAYSYSEEDIRTNIMENLTNDYFCLAFVLHATPTADEASMYSKDKNEAYGMRLWLEYTISDSPIVEITGPADGTSGVEIVKWDGTNFSVRTTTTIYHTDYEDGVHRNMTATWKYLDEATGDWYTFYTVTDNWTWYPVGYVAYLQNATKYSKTYHWKVEVHELGGNWSNTSVYSFTTEPLPAPYNVVCHRETNTSLNVSFSNYASVNWTTIIYKEGAIPSEQDIADFEAGTYTNYINTTNSYGVITGLSPDTCYGLKLRAVRNESGDANFSSYATKDYDDCCLWINIVSLYIRYENTSVNGTNSLINLSKVSPCSNHLLTVTYTDLSKVEFIINSQNYSTYPIELQITKQPLYYELEWNYTTVNDTCSCTDLSPNYRRRLIVDGIDNASSPTFYMIVDRDVYADYLCNGTQITSFKNSNDKNNLAKYDYQVTDDSGLFATYTNYQSYLSFNSSNATTNHIIHQNYIFSDLILDDVVLLYGKTYYVSVFNDIVSKSLYADIYEAKTDNHVSPNTNPIVIPYISPVEETYNDDWDMRVHYSPGGSGLYVYFNEGDTNQITSLYCEVYERGASTPVYTATSNTNNHNFTYNGANQGKEYVILLNYTHVDYDKTPSIVTYLSPDVSEIVSYSYIDNVLNNIFGKLPGNIDDPSQTISWINVIIFFFALIPLSIFGATDPAFAGIGIGFWLVGATLMFSIVSLIPIGIFLIFISIIYKFGGRRR